VTTALSVIQKILREYESIPFVEFTRVSERSPIQEDQGLSDLERTIISQAEKLREEYGIPFWTACLSILDVEQADSNRIVAAAAFHRSIDPEDRFILSRDEVLTSSEDEITRMVSPSHYVAVRSRIHLASEIRHIPMIDMRTDISAFGHSIASRVAEVLLPNGHHILETDSSYHIYGRHPVTSDEWQQVMGRSILFSPFVDTPWVAHQLIEGCAALRLGPKSGNSKSPKVI
jgi:hypothetical protein